jgi:hypothetical protein
MASFNKFNSFVAALAHKVHNLQVDTLKIMLTNVAPLATNAVKADLTEIAAGNGYTAGGLQATQASSGQSAGLYKLVLNDVLFSATGNMATFQYAVLYNDSAGSKELIGWWAYPTAISMLNGETFKVDCDPTTGVLTIQ